MSVGIRILHCLRAPAEGLFRRLHDLALNQAKMGADVGLICDVQAWDEESEALLADVAKHCTLGVTRFPMSRSHVGLGGWLTLSKLAKRAATLKADIVHGHGAAGGAYARLAVQRLRRKGLDVCTVCTPPMGNPHSLMGGVARMAERRLAPLSDGLVFDSRFARQRYVETVGPPPCPTRIVPPGLYRHEFYDSLLDDDAADFAFIGEPSRRNGVDVFLEALAAHQITFPRKAIVVGCGPEEERFRRLARKLGLSARVSFAGRLPARTAFARARCVVVPTRAESFPYVALEAAAARMPLIATNVGAMREIVGDVGMTLIPPGDADALASQMRLFLAEPKAFLARAAALQERVAERFTVEAMTHAVMDFYFSEVGARSHEIEPREAVAVS